MMTLTQEVKREGGSSTGTSKETKRGLETFVRGKREVT